MSETPCHFHHAVDRAHDYTGHSTPPVILMSPTQPASACPLEQDDSCQTTITPVVTPCRECSSTDEGNLHWHKKNADEDGGDYFA